MKKTQKNLVTLAVTFMSVLFFSSCFRSEHIDVSNDQLSFLWTESAQNVSVKANCSWSVENVNNADWFTIEPTSGRKDGAFSVKVSKNDGIQDREAMIKIVSKKGKAVKSIRVLQTTSLVTEGVDFSNFVNSYWGLKREEQWNTDFHGDLIPDTYRLWEFNPNDTTTGIMMYFVYSDSLGYVGFQRDNRGDSVLYNRFNYSIDSIKNQVFLSFDLVDTTQVEEYSIDVQALNASIFKFWHEYKPHFFERSEMSCMGTIDPEKRSFILPKAVGVKPSDSPIFEMK